MAKTQILGRQLKDGTIGRADLNTTVSGDAVVTKIIGSNGLAVASSTGVDAGTGDVTLATDLTFLNTKYPSLEVNRAQNHVFAGPAVGNGNPAFRALVAGDIPVIAISGVMGLQGVLDTKLSGVGSTNRLAKYTGAATLGNSLILDNGTNVAVGHNSPTSMLDVEGTITIRNGTIANMIVPAVNVNGIARSLRFTYNSSATTEGFVFTNTYNNTNLLFISGGGNVGLGTATPTSGKLHIHGVADSSGVGLAISETGGQGMLKITNTWITMERPVGSNANLALITTAQSYGTTGGGIVFQTNGNNAGKITKEGNFGVGNTAPAYRLDVTGNGRFTGDVNFDANAILATVPTANSHLTNKLYVDSKTWAISAVTGLQTALDNKLSGFGATNRVAKYTTAGTLGNSQIYDDGTNVSIGHTSPASKFDIDGTLTLRSGSIVANTIVPAVNINGTERSMRFANLSTAANEGFQFWHSVNGNLMFIANSGNVGLGTTTPTSGKLHIHGVADSSGVGLAISEGSGQGVLKITNSWITMERPAGSLNNLTLITAAQSYGATGGGIVFQTNGNNVGKITKEGNFGIGNTAPAYRLDVTGNGRFTGNVQFDSIATCSVNATLGSHLVNLSTLMAYSSGIKYDTVKVRTVATANITLSGHQTINGYTTSGSDRVLVMGQTTGSQNGVYISGSSAWTRDTNFDTDTEIRGAIHSVQSGTYAGYKFINANTSAITVGTTAIVFTEFSSLVETDPVFSASPAGTISSTNISDWNNGATAFTWGNHASVGYSLASSISGTTNRIAKFTSAGAVGDSQIFDNATGVAVGHTSPASKLDIDGTLTLRSGSIVANTIVPAVSVNGTERSMRFANLSTATNEGFQFWHSVNGNLMFISNSGNIGIGTTTPTAGKLHIHNLADSLGVGLAISEGGGNGILKLTNIMLSMARPSGSNANLTLNTVSGTYGPTGGGILFQTNGSDVAKFTKEGNFGIGNTAPAYRLDVSGNGRFTGDVNFEGKIRLSNNTGADHQFMKFNGTNNEWAYMNTGELQDGGDIVMLTTNNGERGFQLFASVTKDYAESFLFTNPDAGVSLGLHGYAVDASNSIKEFGLQLDTDGLLYHRKMDGTRARILTTDDSLSGGGAWNGGYVTGNIVLPLNHKIFWDGTSESNYGAMLTYSTSFGTNTKTLGFASKDTISLGAEKDIFLSHRGRLFFSKDSNPVEFDISNAMSLLGQNVKLAVDNSTGTLRVKLVAV